MTTVAEMLRRFEAIDLVELTADSMEANNEQVVDLNREQMEAGIYKEGSPIQPQYSNFTVQQKRFEGKPFDRVTLRNTGEFRSKMYLVIRGNEFDVNSTDWKTPDLVAKYNGSGDIFGLTSENKRTAWLEILQPDVVRRIKTQTGAL